MIIIIHRGQNQIGGSIIEITDENTRLFFDIGINLNESENIETPQIEGLFCGERNCDGVFISHYHADHIGLVKNILGGIPIFMGEKAYSIMEAAADYRGNVIGFTPHYINHKNTITIGNFKITPFLCDHSAFDSYMFVIEHGGKKVLYTGDFRANGRLDFEELLADVPEVEVLIIEGTTLSRENTRENIKEEMLEQIACDYLKSKTGPVFVMLSAQNIDRLTTMQNVANKTKRVMLQDIYTAGIAKSAGILSNMTRVFMTTGAEEQHEKLKKFDTQKIGKSEVSKTPFIMCIRQSMKNYLAKLNEIMSFENGVLFYGMWKGYMEQPEMKKFLDFMASKGVKLHVLHTSGHADSYTIDRLVRDAKPKVIIPIHTENAEWFERYDGIKIVGAQNRLVI